MDKTTRNRNYSANTDTTMSALSHPTRSNLFGLIQQGIETVQEMAELLNENRINLYHHLSYLEKAGLVKSHYNEKRMKVYSIIVDDEISLEIQEMESNELVNTVTVAAFPKENRDKEFQNQIRSLLKESVVSHKIPSNVKAIHVQIVFQEKTIYESKQKSLRKMKASKK